MYKILDCTLRDGGYINNWRFNDIFISEYINIMNNLEIDYVEVGFINKTNKYKNDLVGPFRNIDINLLKKFTNQKFKTVVMADYTDINIELLKMKLQIDLVRIAFHKNDMKDALNTCKIVKDLGYNVSVNAMAITNYADDDLKYLFEFINKNDLNILYLADSYGSLSQKDIKNYIETFEKELDTASVGLHLHNNMNNAYSNFEFSNNINNSQHERIIDTTLFGMGRGAGNLQFELVVLHKYPQIDFDNLLSLLVFIQKYIKPIYKIDNNNWGYDLDYLLSGFLKMHPNYIVKMRDLEINMINRFFLIKLLKNNYDCRFFDINIINNLIQLHKNKLL